ncbi:MAG: methylmalonyl-CoA epimerase [Bacteroidetes bacterium QS_8_68_15]|nr:MAG: methylmalonyl-CoA epimerase [Bacteroidetes bacterium QS_8_68_15]
MTPLDHIGLATDDADALADLLEALLDGGRPFASETVAEQHVTARFLPAGAPGAPPPVLELLEPTEAGTGAVGRFLKKRGPGVHHLALRVERLEAALQHASEQGVRLLTDEPQRGAGGKRVAFLHPKDTGGVLVELCEHTAPLPEAERVPFAHDGANGALAAYEFGSEDHPPLLLLHGAAGSTRKETRAPAHRLTPHFQVLALDLPGHGASDRFADAAFSPALFAESARAALDHFGVERAHLFGLSTGGNAALRLAAQHPDRTARLAVHSTCIAWTDALAERMVARLTPAADADADDDDDDEHVGGPATDTLDAAPRDRHALLARTERFVRSLPERTDAMRRTAERVSAPTLVSAADRDELLSLEAGALPLRRRLPDARLAVVPGRRHTPAQTTLGALLPSLMGHLRATGHREA